MNKHTILAAATLLALAALAQVRPAHAAPAKAKAPPAERAGGRCSSVQESPQVAVRLGKSSVVPLAVPVTRIVVDSPAAGGPNAAAAAAAKDTAPSVADMDVQLLSPTDLFVRGKRAGSMNVILQDARGACYLQDIVVTIDPSTLQRKFAELMPDEKEIQVGSAENAVVLTGRIHDPLKLEEAMRLASSYGDGKHVVNLLRVTTPQQVMLEVKIAEVSKTLLDRFGIDFARLFTSADGLTTRVVSGIFGGNPAAFGQLSGYGGSTSAAGSTGISLGGTAVGIGASGAGGAGANATLFGIDAQKKDGLVRVLAEPNIMAISGQSASFLSGGKIFIPVAQSNVAGGTTITLEEKEFGVGLKFTPTVLDGTRVNLKLVSEVSELSQTGSPFTTVGNVTAVLPSLTTRRVDTTVQLSDGQSFAVAGLIRSNVTETLKKFPGLGEIPVLGMLFRSSEFQKDQTELVFIITPRLVKPMSATVALPTDHHAEPTRADAVLMGATEGDAKRQP
ncbi:MAG: type II and III secretion system protein family protein [Telluria sp.]